MNITNALGWTLLHFLWEGTVIAALLYGALLVMRGGSAKARYAASCGALALMLVCAGVTFVRALSTPRSSAPYSPSPVNFQTTAIASSGARVLSETSSTFSMDAYFPALVWLWIAANPPWARVSGR